MDTNIKIIEAVRNCPLLYKKTASIAERQHDWKRIAEKIKLNEPFIKSRWHFLLQRYQNACQQGSYFKYKNQMDYLQPHLRKKETNNVKQYEEEEQLPVNVIKPEFIITEKDLEDDNDNEEYEFLEVETLESNVDQQEEINKEETPPASPSREQLSSNPDKRQHDEATTEDEIDEPKQKVERLSTVKESKQLRKNSDTANVVPKEAKHNKVIVQPIHDKVKKRENVDAPAKQPKETPNTSDVTTQPARSNERCEDAIFGELVTAMLKQMPAEKKRAVKKDIMNLLLS